MPERKIHPSTKLGLLLTELTLITAGTGCGNIISPTQPDIDRSENQPKATEVLPDPGVGKTQVESTSTEMVPTHIVVSTVTTEPTPTEEPTPTIIPTSTWPDFSEGSGGAYLPAQIELITSGALSEQTELLRNWEIWWGQATNNRPFHPETTLLHRVPFFPEDDPNNPEKTIVLWQALGPDYQGKMFYLPIDVENEKFMSTPPGEPVDTIPEGFGPLEVSGGNEGLELANAGGELVRIDPETGYAVQRINFDTGQWENIFLRNWETGLIDGAEIPGRRVRYTAENYPMEGGEVMMFYMGPVYVHKAIRIEEIDPEIKEITWGFINDGKPYKYKVLYVTADMIKVQGEVVSFGKNDIKLGDENGTQVFGLESSMADNPDWVDGVFTEESEAAARKVYGGLKADSDIKTQIENFWANGEMSDEWHVDTDGVVDLTELVVLTW